MQLTDYFMFMQLRLQKRRLMLCHSTSPSKIPEMLHSELPCDVIYIKEFQHGTLYALLLKKQTLVGTMDDKIKGIDTCMQSRSGDTSTRFTSICDMLSGKIKTFGKNEHKSDEHYGAIFSMDGHFGRKNTKTLQGVHTWNPPASGNQPIIPGVETSSAAGPGAQLSPSANKRMRLDDGSAGVE